jgi:predicted ATPase
MLFDDLKLNTTNVIKLIQLLSSIFTAKEEVFAFQRALSRLIEMQGINVIQLIQWLGSELAKQINGCESKVNSA